MEGALRFGGLEVEVVRVCWSFFQLLERCCGSIGAMTSCGGLGGFS